MLNFLIRKVCSSGSGWEGPSLNPQHPDLWEPGWVGDPEGTGTVVCAVLLGCEGSCPSAVGCTSQVANICLMEQTPLDPVGRGGHMFSSLAADLRTFLPHPKASSRRSQAFKVIKKFLPSSSPDVR